MIWYHKTRLAQTNAESGAVNAPLSKQAPPQNNIGINGPPDENKKSKNVNDPYAVGRTRAIYKADEMLKNPNVDYFETGLESKLEQLHHENQNVLGPQSMSSMEDGAITYKGQNSVDIAHTNDNRNNVYFQDKPATLKFDKQFQ